MGRPSFSGKTGRVKALTPTKQTHIDTTPMAELISVGVDVSEEDVRGRRRGVDPADGRHPGLEGSAQPGFQSTYIIVLP